MAKKASSKGIGLDAPTAMPVNTTAKQAAQEKRWQVEEDLRTLRRAEEIRSDSGRVRLAKQMAALEMKALAKVAK